MVFCISVFAVCLLLMFVCLVSVVADPSSCNFKEWVYSVLADTVGSILFRYLGCAFVVAGMTFSVGAAYAAEEGPGEDPAPVVSESAAATPVPSLGDDHAPEDPVITMPPDYSPPAVTTSEPYMTPASQEEAPEPETTPDNTPGYENEPTPGELPRESDTPSNTPASTSRPAAPVSDGGGTFGGPEIFDPVATVEPTPMLVGEYQQQMLYDVAYIEGLLCFIVVVILCYFSYKFFRIFF